MDKTLLWLWLTTKKIHENNQRHLWEKYGGIEHIYNETSYDVLWLSNTEKRLLSDKDLTNAREVLLKTKNAGASVITYDDDIYPEILKNIADPPFVLYVKGKLLNMDKELGIGVVGTRKNSEYGRKITHDICCDLTSAGVVIVSGLARGIDTIAANAAISTGGRTVGVLGCGIDVVYPAENTKIYESVSEHGMIITEYPPGTSPYGYNFPRRNRIIAGLSRGVLVTEAPIKSGALITAHIAMEEGRDVFAIPRGIDSRFAGGNNLIQNGAKLVFNYKDILNEYPYMRLTPAANQHIRKKDAFIPVEESKPQVQNISPEIEEKNEKDMYKERYEEIYNKCNASEKKLIDLIGKNTVHIDELVRGSGMETGKVNTMLMIMEMRKIIRKLPGNKYELKF